MRYLTVLMLTALLLNVGCERPISNPEQASVGVAKEHELVVRPVTAEYEAPPDVRFALTAQHAGKLLVRVREPLLVMDPPLIGRSPGFVSADRAPWAESSGYLKFDGLAQRVLDLSDEDLAAPLALEVRVVHPREPDEMVRVQLTLHRSDKKESWPEFYQCRPAAKTTRASSNSLTFVAGVDTGSTIMLCSYDFGGETSEVEVPLTRDGKQWIVVELGWKSSLDLTR